MHKHVFLILLIYCRYQHHHNADGNASGQRSKIGYKRALDLLNKEPDTIVLELSNSNFGFDEYMAATSMSDDLISVMLQALDKAFSCNSLAGQKLKLIEKLVSSNFLNQLVYNNIEHIKDKTTGGYNIALIKSLINVLNFILKCNPSVLNEMDKFIDKVEIVVKIRIKTNSELSKEFDDKLTAVKDGIISARNATNKRQISSTYRNNFLTSNDNLEPNDKIVNITVSPTLDEICKYEKPFLRKNIIDGPYKSVDHYLDIHFRLLREDFLKPLRDGVREFKAIIKDYKTRLPNWESSDIHVAEVFKKVSHIEALRVYMDVKFVSNLCADSGVTFTLQLNKEKLKNINWEFTKRLLFGSMICLSNDYFENNFIVAIVCDRDIEKLKEGKIGVKLDGNANFTADNNKYIMFETTAYFEAYRHVLNALRTLSEAGENNFPFKSNIIYCQNDAVQTPNYLIKALIDFRPLVVNKKKLIHVNPQTGLTTYDFDATVNYAKECRVDRIHQWPSPQQMNLDASQYEAIMLALTQKISLIQG